MTKEPEKKCTNIKCKKASHKDWLYCPYCGHIKRHPGGNKLIFNKNDKRIHYQEANMI